MWPLCPSVTGHTEGDKVASRVTPTNIPYWPQGSGPPRLPSACHMVADGYGGRELDSSAPDGRSTYNLLISHRLDAAISRGNNN